MDKKIIAPWISLRTFFSSLRLGVSLRKVKHAVFSLQYDGRYTEFDKRTTTYIKVVIFTENLFHKEHAKNIVRMLRSHRRKVQAHKNKQIHIQGIFRGNRYTEQTRWFSREEHQTKTQQCVHGTIFRSHTLRLSPILQSHCLTSKINSINFHHFF